MIKEKGAQDNSDYRISKTAWLSDDDNSLLMRVTQRVADLSGLSMASAEALQVANYGIGGHYMQHYDFVRIFNIAPKEECKDRDVWSSILSTYPYGDLII